MWSTPGGRGGGISMYVLHLGGIFMCGLHPVGGISKCEVWCTPGGGGGILFASNM